MRHLPAAPLRPYLQAALERIQEGNGWRLDILADRLGVSYRTILRIFEHETITLDTADKICTGLQIDHPSVIWPEFSGPEICRKGHPITKENSYFGKTGKYADCKTCRAERHKREHQARKLVPIPHGTLSGYSWHKCRCAECKAAHRDYVRGWRAKR